uniref:Uncharacterized protein n=1 Tax=Clonostachys compactiuscula TaxID=122660 RepID=A0A8F1Y2G2_9HYPO|nr:hypothetical protein [Clonostachys compactiuscula]
MTTPVRSNLKKIYIQLSARTKILIFMNSHQLIALAHIIVTILLYISIIFIGMDSSLFTTVYCHSGDDINISIPINLGPGSLPDNNGQDNTYTNHNLQYNNDPEPNNTNQNHHSQLQYNSTSPYASIGIRLNRDRIMDVYVRHISAEQLPVYIDYLRGDNSIEALVRLRELQGELDARLSSDYENYRSSPSESIYSNSTVGSDDNNSVGSDDNKSVKSDTNKSVKSDTNKSAEPNNKRKFEEDSDSEQQPPRVRNSIR